MCCYKVKNNRTPPIQCCNTNPGMQACGAGATEKVCDFGSKNLFIEAAVINKAPQVVQKTNFIHICTSFARALRGGKTEPCSRLAF